MSDTIADTITDDALPGWRAVIHYDMSASEPYGDALAPALLVWDRWDRGRPEWGSQVYRPTDADTIAGAFRHYADDDLFTRYLRIWHGVTTVEHVSHRDGTVLIFDTADWRSHVGMPEHALPADLSGEAHEWRAYVDGDVYGVVVEHHRTGTTTWDDDRTDDVDDWEHVDSCWGFFGFEYATERATEMLHEAT